jgi:carbon storage regulator
MGESIMINDEIELKVLRIKGRQVHIGIDAPHSTTVHRREVWDRIRSEGMGGANGAVRVAALEPAQT